MTWAPDAKPQSSRTWAKEIEDRTKQKLSIETALNNATLAKSHPQWQSPLYQIPKEIRDLILLFASTQSPDPEHEYSPTAHYYRPGHTARLKTHTAFLLTCKKIWLEANSLPMQQAEHAFWFQRGPFDVEIDKRWPVNVRREQHRYEDTLRSMTSANLANFTHLHLFLQMFQAEQFVHHYILDTFFPKAQLLRGLRLKVFQVTVRHSDWTDWEVDRPLYLNEKWVQAILDEPRLGGVEEFWLELETWESKKSQLDPIVKRIRELESKPKLADPIDPNCKTASKFVFKDEPVVWNWSRSPRLQDHDWPIYKDIATLNLHVVVLKWRAVYSPADDESRKLSSIQLNATEPALFFPRPLPSFRGLAHTIPAHNVAAGSAAKAEMMEQERRDMFARLMGELEARKLREEWEAKGSLLKLEGSVGGDYRSDRSNGRPDLNWLNKFRT